MTHVGKGWFLNMGFLNQIMFGVEWDVDFWYFAINLGPLRVFVSSSDPLALMVVLVEDEDEQGK